MLLEKTVQKRAMTFLANYYDNRLLRRRMFAAEEVRTKKIYGGKRADGLLAYQSRLSGNPFVVSMEAKSIKTLPAIKPYHDWSRWVWNSLRFSLFLCFASGLAYLALQGQTNLEIFVPVIWCLCAGIAFGLLTWNSYRHQTIDVITQLKQYPANEQWLAFSKDAFAALTTEKQELLRTVCKYRGIGLLLIGRNNSTDLLQKPKRRWSWIIETRGGWQLIRDFLVYYSKEKEIRKFI